MTKIIDDMLDPFYIEISENNHTVLENTGKKDKKGELIIKTHGYYNSVGGSLNKINKLLTLKDEDDLTLSGYITKLNTIKEELLKIN